MLPVLKARTIVSVALLSFVLYWAHRLLQLQHYRHCRADLFRVVLNSQSTLCTHVGTVLHLVEFVYHQSVRIIAAHALGALGAGIGFGDVGVLTSSVAAAAAAGGDAPTWLRSCVEQVARAIAG
jgi:hypothetical protein